MKENTLKLQEKFEEVTALIEKFDSQSAQLQSSQKQLEEAAKLIKELVERFGPQSEQIHSSQRLLNYSQKQLDEASNLFDMKFEEVVQSVYSAINKQERELRDIKNSYKETIEILESASNNFNLSTGAIKNAFDEKNFLELCCVLEALTQEREACKLLRDDFLALRANIIEEVCQKIEAEMASIRAQQEDDRAFMESKFAELFEKLNPITNITSCNDAEA